MMRRTGGIVGFTLHRSPPRELYMVMQRVCKLAVSCQLALKFSLNVQSIYAKPIRLATTFQKVAGFR